MIALLCSVQAEADHLLEPGRIAGKITLGSKLLVQGMIGRQQVALCSGGMGKVNAAHAASLLITQFSPEALVVFGIGGAYPSSGAAVGDIALAREEIAGDEGVMTPDGFRDTEFIGIPLVETASSLRYSSFPSSEPLLTGSVRALLSQGGQNRARVHTGAFVTLSTCTGTAARARELEQRYGGLCENMEGAAAAQVAELHHVPWLEVRGISNMVEDRDTGKWDIPGAAEAARQAVRRILEVWNQ